MLAVAADSIHRFTFGARGCTMALWVATEDERAAAARLGDARSLIERAERRLSRFLDTSEVSRLNASAGRAVRVSPDLEQVLMLALHGARRTGGLYDPTVLDALEAAGDDRPFDGIRCATPAGPAPAAHGSGSWRAVRVDPFTATVTLPAGVRLDCGGIARAWAAEQAAARLSDLGPCLVDAGGDIAVRGAPPRWPGWPIRVADPYNDRRDLAVIAVSSRGVATSGTDYRRWRRGGRMVHHVIDPRTHRPAGTDLVSVTVVAEDAVEANIHAVAALILGSRDAVVYLHQAGVDGLVVRADGGVRTTPGFHRHAWPGPAAGGGAGV